MQQFRSYLYNAVLTHPDNRAAKFVSTSNRSSAEKPLTIDMLQKSLFSCFLYREPVAENMTTDAYKRETEISNMVEIFNMLHDLALAGWNPQAGPSDTNQTKLERMFRSKSIMAWSELFRDAVCGKLELQDAEDRARPLYRELSKQDIDRMRNVASRLTAWKYWCAPAGDEIDRVLVDAKREVKDWFRSHDLTAGYLMGAPS